MSAQAAGEIAAAQPPAGVLDCLRRLPPERRLTASWTAGELRALAEWRAAELAESPGEPVGLRMENGEVWILALLALLQAGMRPVLIAADAPDAERDRVLARAGGARWLSGDATGLELVGEAAPGIGGEPGVFLTTSGSTGVPKLAFRDEASLISEGVRYKDCLDLDGTDRLLLPLPLSHAYALGWLMAALVTGSEVRTHPPSALNAIAGELADGATIIALVPTMARLLATRQLRRRGPAPALRMAMVGAGPVDEALERDVIRSFGLVTARNYGSTETGALFAGAEKLPPRSVGRAMPGVRHRIVDETGRPCLPGQGGALEVQVNGDLRWRPTGDLAVGDEDGLVTILGRRHSAVRRGGRWVAPLEVEAVLREHPAVRDAHVYGGQGRFQDEDQLIADVVIAGNGVRDSDLQAFARQRLAPYKVPDEVRLRGELYRTETGKVVARPRYRLADADPLLAAARAYKVSELLFALRELGLLDLLRRGADADQIAARLRLPVQRVEWLLSMAAGLGLVRADAAAEKARKDQQPDVDAFVRLESLLSRGWVTRDALIEAVRAEPGERPFERADLGLEFPSAYQKAMHGPDAHRRTRIGLSLLRGLVGGRVLEVSAGPGRYLDAILSARPEASGYLVRLGRLSGPISEGILAGYSGGRVDVGDRPPRRAFDVCVVANGIHGPSPGDDLSWLLDSLREDGLLLVDDVFLPEDAATGTEIGLDWLTHGGISWPRISDLKKGVAASGGNVGRVIGLASSQCSLIVVNQG